MNSRIIAAIVICFLVLPVDGGENAGKRVADAFKKVAAAESYAFSTTENKADAVEAKYQKGQPIYCKAEKIECFKKGETVVYLDGEKWLKSRRGTLSDPLRVLGAISKVNTLRLPHEDLAALDKKVKKLEKADGMVYKGELTQEGIQAFVRSEHKGVAKSGKIEIQLNDKGEVLRYEIDIRLQGRIGNAEIDGNATRSVILSALGATKVEVPPAAGKALE